jgi:hypothetical protein
MLYMYDIHTVACSRTLLIFFHTNHESNLNEEWPLDNMGSCALLILFPTRQATEVTRRGLVEKCLYLVGEHARLELCFERMDKSIFAGVEPTSF